MFRGTASPLCPDSEGNWLNEQSLKMYVGGAEYNVAAALSQWKNSVSCYQLCLKILWETSWNFSLKIKNRSPCRKTQGRIGTFYLSSDSDMQNASVVYDRFPSVFTQSDFEVFSDDEIFQR
ncbi:hypothetical protein EJ377_01370 [Chryseobacterium arthrosphaerae]|uniref:Carbohydrate kinase PfkB domain-containing protein n=1 Tax=Chryseobacterium arthrosphaerae TaxID=651561 RepID=A0A432DYC8_9FLAO|nr:hypothetical protein EJ377_01370 [Chryseobacterium arthrosphaerae]